MSTKKVRPIHHHPVTPRIPESDNEEDYYPETSAPNPENCFFADHKLVIIISIIIILILIVVVTLYAYYTRKGADKKAAIAKSDVAPPIDVEELNRLRMSSLRRRENMRPAQPGPAQPVKAVPARPVKAEPARAEPAQPEPILATDNPEPAVTNTDGYELTDADFDNMLLESLNASH